MKELIIIGAGGLGRSIYDLATECTGFQNEFIIKGFLDDNPSALKGYNNYPPVIGTIGNYEISKNDVFAISVGDVQTKKKIVLILESKKGVFINLVHPTARLGKNVNIGNGCIISRNVILGPDSSIGSFVLIQAAVIAGHDTKIGNFSRIDCNVVCVGGTIVENECTIHTAAIINHNVIVRTGAVVGAGSFVIREVKENTTVFGSPAKRLE